MAIGDNLVPFTPELANAGIRLIPSGSTPPIGPVSAHRPRSMLNVPVAPARAHERGTFLSRPTAPAGAPLLSTGLTSPTAQETPSQGQDISPVPLRGPSLPSLLPPDEVRPLNPFDPTQRIAPEDDALTPPGTLAPSEIKRQGDFFSKVGDFLSTPGFTKLLASIGASISGEDEVTQFATETAESQARGQFEQRLEAGERPEDIDIFGLSLEGREGILSRREEQRRVEGVEARAERQVEISAGNLALNQSKFNAAEDQQVISNLLAGERIEVSKLTEERLVRQADDLAAYRDASLQIQRDELASLDAWRKAQRGGGSGSTLDAILRMRQVAEATQEQLESHREGIFAIEDEILRLEGNKPGILKRLKPGDQGAAYERDFIAPAKERLQAARDLETAMQESISNLTNAASTALGITPVTSEEVAARRAATSNFPTEAAARAAGFKAGDKVTIDGVRGTLK